MNEYFHHVTRGIIIKENKILISEAEGFPNDFFLPGGHVEFGESAKDALKREFMEELGIPCRIDSFLGIVESKWSSQDTINCEVNQLFLISSDHLHTDSNPLSKETHLRFLWLDVNNSELMKLQPHPIGHLIQQFVNGNKEVWWESTLHSK